LLFILPPPLLSASGRTRLNIKSLQTALKEEANRL